MQGLEAMRDAMVDRMLSMMTTALNTGDTDTYERIKQRCSELTSPGWELYLIESRPADSKKSEYLILTETLQGPAVEFRFHDTYVTTVFAVHQSDFDQRGWVDPQGLSFYERLRYGGYENQFVWTIVTENEWQDLVEEFRVLHPRELLYHPKKRRLEIVIKPDKFKTR